MIGPGYFAVMRCRGVVGHHTIVRSNHPAKTGSETSSGSRDPSTEVAAGFPVTDRPTWLILIGVGLLVAAVVVWAGFGRAPDTVAGPGIVSPSEGFTIIGQAVQGTVENVEVSEGDDVQRGAVLAYVRGGDGDVKEVKAPLDGRVVAVLARPGLVTTVGTSIFTMVPDGDRDVAIGFIDAGPGERVQPGMLAHVSPASEPRSQYGTIIGRIESVSPMPVSIEQVLLDVGGNESLAQHFVARGPVLKVTVELQHGETPTGYSWTVGEGPQDPVTTGTLAEVSIELSDASLLERML